MCSDLIFNLLKSVAGGSFLYFYTKRFSFSTFLEFGPQMMSALAFNEFIRHAASKTEASDRFFRNLLK